MPLMLGGAQVGLGALDITIITSSSSTSASGFTNSIMPIPQTAREFDHGKGAPDFLPSGEPELGGGRAHLRCFSASGKNTPTCGKVRRLETPG